MTTFLLDLRYAVRQLLRTPGFALVAVLTLGLGIGVTSTLFSLINSVFLKPRGVAEPERLVDIYMRSQDFPSGAVSFPDYEDLRAESRSLSGAAAYRLGTLGYGAADGIRSVWTETVTANYFEVLGVPAALGRTFAPSDDREGAALVAVVSERFFRRDLAANPAAIGRAILLNGQPFEVVGVAPASFTGMVRGLVPEVWIPSAATLGLYPGTTQRIDRSNHSYFVKARLAPGARFEEARAEADAIGRRLAEIHPETNRGLTFAAFRAESVVLNPMVDGAVTGAAFVLMAVPVLVLLIACANLATLLLTRATSRQRELAVRLALGAGRARVIRQLVTESMLLGLLGGAVGLLFCLWASQLLLAFRPPLPLPLSLDAGVDVRVLVFTLMVALLAGVGFGAVPALRATSSQPAQDLHEGRAGGGVRAPRLRAALVAGQLAVSVLLLVSAGLLVRGLAGAARLDLGFDPAGTATLSVDLTFHRMDAATGRRFLVAALDRILALPGVSAASFANRPPVDLNVSADEVLVEGRLLGPDERAPFMQNAIVGPGYFAAIGARVERGREFTREDGVDAPQVVAVNRAAARQLWPNEDPIGRRLRTGAGDQQPWREVVAVVGDIRVNTPGEQPTPQLFFPLLQRYEPYQTFLVRTGGDPTSMLPLVRRAVTEANPEVTILSTGLLADRVAAGLWPARFAATLLAGLGLAGLAIASLGLYGSVAHAVSQRTRELGVRVALGAHTRDVLSLVLREGMTTVALGLVAGLVLAGLASQALRAFLYGVSPWDPAAFLAGPLVLALVGLAACYAPARRATRVDPVEALRSE